MKSLCIIHITQVRAASIQIRIMLHICKTNQYFPLKPLVEIITGNAGQGSVVYTLMHRHVWADTVVMVQITDDFNL